MIYLLQDALGITIMISFYRACIAIILLIVTSYLSAQVEITSDQRYFDEIAGLLNEPCVKFGNKYFLGRFEIGPYKNTNADALLIVAGKRIREDIPADCSGFEYDDVANEISYNLASIVVSNAGVDTGIRYEINSIADFDDLLAGFAITKIQASGDVDQSPDINFIFGESVSVEEENLIRDAAISSEEFFKSQALPSFSPLAFVHVYDDYDELLEAHVEVFTPALGASIGLSIPSTGLTLDSADESWGGGSGQGQAFGNYLFIYAGNSFWKTFASENHKTRTVAHELFHVMQYQLLEGPMFAGPNINVPLAGPRWIIEGSAELAGYMMLDWVGLSDFDSERQSAINAAARTEYGLDEMENSPGFYPIETAYQIALTAVAFLSTDLSKYATYFSSITDEVPWEEAFLLTFGKDVNTFYAEFEEYADNGYQ